MFNWCFIGASNIASIVAKEMVGSKTNRIFSVWNRTHEKAVKFGKKYNAIVFDDVDEAISDSRVDGVYISLTNDLHYEYVKMCIEHHKPVLCEKPFMMNVKQSKEIFELARKNKVYLSEAMWTWHNKTAYKVKEWLKEIGEIKEVECAFSFVGTSVDRLINPNKLGGALLDIGVYGLRYSLELFGFPREIKCTGRLFSGVDLNEEVIFQYDNFIVKHRFAIDEDFGIFYRIKGEKGMIEIPFFQAGQKAVLEKENKEIFIDDSKLYENQFVNVAKEIREGLLESKIITKENTLLCMELMDECRRQIGLMFPNEK